MNVLAISWEIGRPRNIKFEMNRAGASEVSKSVAARVDRGFEKFKRTVVSTSFNRPV